MDLVEDALEGEQAILDEHDDRVSRLVRVQQLVSTVTQAVVAPSVTTSGVRLPKISVPTFDHATETEELNTTFFHRRYSFAL